MCPKKAEYLGTLLNLLHVEMIMFLIYWVNNLLKLSLSFFNFFNVTRQFIIAYVTCILFLLKNAVSLL